MCADRWVVWCARGRVRLAQGGLEGASEDFDTHNQQQPTRGPHAPFHTRGLHACRKTQLE